MRSLLFALLFAITPSLVIAGGKVTHPPKHTTTPPSSPQQSVSAQQTLTNNNTSNTNAASNSHAVSDSTAHSNSDAAANNNVDTTVNAAGGDGGSGGAGGNSDQTQTAQGGSGGSANNAITSTTQTRVQAVSLSQGSWVAPACGSGGNAGGGSSQAAGFLGVYWTPRDCRLLSIAYMWFQMGNYQEGCKTLRSTSALRAAYKDAGLSLPVCEVLVAALPDPKAHDSYVTQDEFNRAMKKGLAK